MDAARLRAAFPVLRETAYLNAGTCGPLAQATMDAATAAWELGTRAGRAGAFYQRLEEASAGLRARYAGLLDAQTAELALTAGSSDGIGRVVAGLSLGAGDEIVTADDEHPGLQGPLLAARLQRGVRIRAVALHDVADAVSPATRLVACSHVSWSSGRLAPLHQLAEIARRGTPVLLDGAQAVGAVPVDVAALGATFYAGSGQKWLGGPVGTGMLWVDPAWRDRIAVAAPAYGNLDEPSRGLDARPAPDARRFDLPTQDLPTVQAAAAAFDVLAEAGWPSVQARAVAQAARLADTLRERGHEVAPRDPTTLVAWSCESDAEALAVRDRLAGAGVIIRDLPGRARLRASVGAWNDGEDLERLLAELA